MSTTCLHLGRRARLGISCSLVAAAHVVGQVLCWPCQGNILGWHDQCLLRKVHGLLVGKDDEASGAMRAICSHLHVFRSWSAMEDVKRR